VTIIVFLSGRAGDRLPVVKALLRPRPVRSCRRRSQFSARRSGTSAG
jgi:hypothetical protein